MMVEDGSWDGMPVVQCVGAVPRNGLLLGPLCRLLILVWLVVHCLLPHAIDLAFGCYIGLFHLISVQMYGRQYLTIPLKLR